MKYSGSSAAVRPYPTIHRRAIGRDGSPCCESLEELGKAMGGKGNLALDNEAAIQRTEGIKKVVKEKFPDIKVVREQTGNWKRDQGKTSVTRARQLWRTGLLPARRSTASPQTTTRWRWGRCRRSRLPENSGEVLLGQPLSTCLHQLSPLVHFRDPPRRRSRFVYISRRPVGSGGFT